LNEAMLDVFEKAFPSFIKTTRRTTRGLCLDHRVSFFWSLLRIETIDFEISSIDLF